MANTKVFNPSHQLTFDTAQSDCQRLLTLLTDDKITAIRFNLQEVKQCDSAGLALLIEAKRLCRQYKKDLIIDGMSPSIYALAEFCGVDTLLECG